MKSLSIKYRPKEFFGDYGVLGQDITVKILAKQLETNNIKNCYLFVGPSGCGKTTTARILAKKLNGVQIGTNGEEKILGLQEIDAASNNGVDNIRSIIEDAKLRSLDGGQYKIYIIDECHSLTIQAWQVFLKALEEPPKYAIFIFCTTNIEKVPLTIRNRMSEFYLSKVDSELIYKRLVQICENENYINYKQSCDYIAKVCNGSVRLAISYLDKVSDYSTSFDLNETIKILGLVSYEVYFRIICAILKHDEKTLLELLKDIDTGGKNIKNFIEDFISFILDLIRYINFNDITMTSIPVGYENYTKSVSSVKGSLGIYHLILDELLELKANIKYDTNVYSTIVGSFIQISERVYDYANGGTKK